ncbi:hypothetical protein ACIBG8_15375 [Nonomuraea sp. NPDC050556]|uniref:hypothetical protein n=1 Tax=Nonomuraea sp. NPDC050556 TaxID=3364369 RepID=UPI0037A74CCD
MKKALLPLIAACLLAAQAGPAHAATNGRYFNKACQSRFNCMYYLRPDATQAVKEYLDEYGWTVDAASNLICYRLPLAAGVACGIAISVPYRRALPHLEAASDMGGCFTIHAKLPIARFGSVSPDDPNCY